MNFKFEKVIPEKIYDNHSCPCLTEYRLNFTVDEVEGRAIFSNVWGGIDIYLYKGGWAKIKCRHGLDYSKVRSAIQNAFQENEEVKKMFHKAKGDELEVTKNELCQKLLQSDNWS